MRNSLEKELLTKQLQRKVSESNSHRRVDSQERRSLIRNLSKKHAMDGSRSTSSKRYGSPIRRHSLKDDVIEGPPAFPSAGAPFQSSPDKRESEEKENSQKPMKLMKQVSVDAKEKKRKEEMELMRRQREIRKSQTKVEEMKLQRQLSMNTKQNKRESEIEMLKRQRSFRRSQTLTRNKSSPSQSPEKEDHDYELDMIRQQREFRNSLTQREKSGSNENRIDLEAIRRESIQKRSETEIRMMERKVSIVEKDKERQDELDKIKQQRESRRAIQIQKKRQLNRQNSMAQKMALDTMFGAASSTVRATNQV